MDTIRRKTANVSACWWGCTGLLRFIRYRHGYTNTPLAAIYDDEREIMLEQQQASQNPPTFGRYGEIPPEQFSPEQKEAYDYILSERGMCPGPYRIWLQNPELLKAMTPIGVYYQKKLQISRQEHEIVTNCINGKWATAGYSNKEHEEIAEKAGLPAEKVQALIAGLPTSFEDPRQQVIYEITQTLIASRRVPQGLYEQAIDLLGDAGLTDVTVLIGYFTSVSMTLAVYDVPSGRPLERIGTAKVFLQQPQLRASEQH
jgi:4-carboxymuconolactone decarboxylase